MTYRTFISLVCLIAMSGATGCNALEVTSYHRGHGHYSYSIRVAVPPPPPLRIRTYETSTARSYDRGDDYGRYPSAYDAGRYSRDDSATSSNYGRYNGGSSGRDRSYYYER